MSGIHDYFLARTMILVIPTLGFAAACILALAYLAGPAFAAHCISGNPCPRQYPSAHPAADRGFMWACAWPDDRHYTCHTVRAGLCGCDPSSTDFRDRDNYYQAWSMMEASDRCLRQNGSPTMVPSTQNKKGSAEVYLWQGLTCDFPGDQDWFESHPTTDICVNAVNEQKDEPPRLVGPNLIQKPTFCCSLGTKADPTNPAQRVCE
jgi:hypothetical protein